MKSAEKVRFLTGVQRVMTADLADVEVRVAGAGQGRGERGAAADHALGRCAVVDGSPRTIEAPNSSTRSSCGCRHPGSRRSLGQLEAAAGCEQNASDKTPAKPMF